MSTAIEQRARFDLIRYANCWEDADILCAALNPGPGKTIVSIASGGDNSFALLAGGATVIAADISPAQLACVELKRAAIRRLTREEVLAFLGLQLAANRPHVYAELRSRLPEAARAFWDAHPADIAAGIAHAGKFERFFRIFRRFVLPLIHPPAAIAALLAEQSPEAREQFYACTWNNRRWRLLFRVFFSRAVMGRLGRDPEFFRYVEGSVADRILDRARYALTTLPTHDNPYLQFILRGTFDPALPRYLRPEHYDAVRASLDRLVTFLGPIEEGARAAGGADGFNLSDIFEYLDAATVRRLYGDLLSTARPGARLAYWNMLVPRSCPEEFSARVTPLDELAADLFAQDRAFFYSAFRVEEVRP